MIHKIKISSPIRICLECFILFYIFEWYIYCLDIQKPFWIVRYRLQYIKAVSLVWGKGGKWGGVLASVNFCLYETWVSCRSNHLVSVNFGSYGIQVLLHWFLAQTKLYFYYDSASVKFVLCKLFTLNRFEFVIK